MYIDIYTHTYISWRVFFLLPPEIETCQKRKSPKGGEGVISMKV